jgi:FtsZ-interacting cell division protein ZipA
MIPNPWVIIGVIIFVISTFFYGHHKGWNQRDAEMQAEIAIKNEESRTKEQEMNVKLNEQSSKLMEANNGIAEKQTALDRAIRSGRVRLPTPSCVQAPTNTSIAPTNSQETGSKPDRPPDQASDAERATLQAIAEIVAQGDRNTAQLNACIDAYNQTRETVNGKP